MKESDLAFLNFSLDIIDLGSTHRVSKNGKIVQTALKSMFLEVYSLLCRTVFALVSLEIANWLHFRAFLRPKLLQFLSL